MSTKFEQLLDYIVNEEMDKADALFHEIVVEKSRSIYENLIAEEAGQDAQLEFDDEDAVEETDDEYEEGYHSMEEEYGVDETADEIEDGEEGDATGELFRDVEADGSEEPAADTGDAGDLDASEEDAIKREIQDVIDQLQDTFKMMSGDEMPGEPGDEMPGEPGNEMDFDSDEEKKTDEMMGLPEGRRMTREYVEKVAAEKGPHAGAGTGETMPAGENNKSVVASGKGKVQPGSGAGTHNIVAKSATAAEDGTKPHGKAAGLVKPAQDMKTGQGNVPGGKMGVKNLSKVAGGHGAEKKGSEPGPVGAGTGDKAGQTSIDPATKKQFLPGFGK